jgi:hypothetical protein
MQLPKRVARSRCPPVRRSAEKDSTSPAVVEILLEDVERLEAEKERLASFQEKYHAKDKEAAILMSQRNSWQKGDVLYTICIAIGSAFRQSDIS